MTNLKDEDYAYETSRQRRIDDHDCKLDLPRIGATYQAAHRPQTFHRTDPHKNIPYTLKDIATQEIDAFEKCVAVICAVTVTFLIILGAGSV